MNPAHLVLRDLLDAAVTEGLVRPAVASGVATVAVAGGVLRWSARDGGALSATRYADGPVVFSGADEHEVGPDEVAALLFPDAPALDAVVRDLRAAVAHAAVVPTPSRANGTLAASTAANGPVAPQGEGGEPEVEALGERWAASRNRPFHPTARAVAGWSVEDLQRWGPGAQVDLHAVAVRADHVRAGPGGFSWPVSVPDGFVALPVHPHDAERVLPTVFAAEMASGHVSAVGAYHPQQRSRATASLRTFDLGGGVHLKLPLGVATLGSTRLLPPRHLDHGDRGQRLLHRVLAVDPALADRVAVCDESSWASFALPDGSDAFDDRPGRLAAQHRRWPAAHGVRVPLGAFAADAWAAMAPRIGEPEELLPAVIEAFVAVGIGFLRHGVLPEVHGQNVVLDLAPGRVRLVLRDHDAVRVHAPWLDVAGPDYRIAPGARQSLVLDDPAALVGFFQTLGVQVGLFGAIDAVVRHRGGDERRWWREVRGAVERALATDTAVSGAGGPGGSSAGGPERTAVLAGLLLDAPDWPHRSVLGPLLERGPSDGTSMPAGVTRVPNPLRWAS